MPDASTPPSARPRAPRLPGTYAANYGDDPDWRRGVGVLWTFFVLTVVGEMTLAAFVLLRGGIYPVPADAIRVGVEGALFVALWLGWGWLRWPLAGLNFLYGAWLIVWLISGHAAEAARHAELGLPAPGYGLASIPQLGQGLAYLAYAGYLTFSADVLDFLRHRRERGRGWIVLPVIGLVAVYLLALFGAGAIHSGWIALEERSARQFVTQSLAAIAADHWSVASYEERADPAYLETWYEGDRKTVFATLSRLGEYRRAETPLAAVSSEGDATGSGFVVRGQVDLGPVEFAHGRTRVTWNITRTLFGPWKLQGFNADRPQFDDPPAGASQ